MNGQSLRVWDDELVAWTQIKLELTINFNINVNNHAYIAATFPTVNDSYSTQLTNSGIISHTYTFSREAFNESSISTNAFQVYTGMEQVGDGADVPPFFRNLLAHLIQSGYFDQSVSWNIPWAYNYTAVGPPVSGIPTNASGTLFAYAGTSLDLSLSNTAPITPTWTGGVFSSDGSGTPYPNVGTYADDFSGSSVIIPFPNWIGISDVGPDIEVDTFKTHSGAAIDFGVTLTQDDSSAVTSYWNGLNYAVTSAVQNVTLKITCS